MKKKFVTSLAIGLGLLFMVSIAHAAILDISGGQLFGATDVDVNGILYDVAFRDGTCIELYGGADENSDFPFTNLENLNDTVLIRAANQALFDQVFVDSELGAFDSTPNLTNGCGASGFCLVYTPLSVNDAHGGLGIVGVRNDRNEYNDNILAIGSVHRTFDTGWWSDPRDDRAVYAVWSEATPVPIPGAVWLFGSGLAALIGLRRKKK